MNIHDDMTGVVGNTPMVNLKFDKLADGVNIYAKLEFQNPLGSIKDRPSKYMIKDGEERGLINPETLIVEATSGNTGIGLGFICASKNYRLILTMPDSMSIERRKLLKHLGADLVLTDATLGMKGAIEKAKEIAEKNPNSFIPDQFSNPANVRSHRETTAVEILNDLDGKADILVSGVGTGGTITGVSQILKKKNPRFRSIAVEPYDSPVLSGGDPAPHKIQGIGAGFVPEILDIDLIDAIETVTNQEAFQMARILANSFGILCGISSGAAVNAALKIGKNKENEGKNIVVILPSTGERYLSTPLFLS
ncbi:MAG: cysteine synthase A [Desulfobacterales bacterium]|nr:cysteine synthase A [Desulfobacterales bacterium]MCP4159233.1 cysteine synthase A [Deltaproteobacteria bacterium]